MIDSEDTSHMILAIETIALISATNNGKILLEKNSEFQSYLKFSTNMLCNALFFEKNKWFIY